ncbi:MULTISPECIES: arginase family protein [unclassified Actinopolyspora]|uniref:arginase family protein n=1 Tax=unclassified Actinopolyspora TaxID=2639451 RepID=UPI0013F5CA04|nr:MULTISPECIES: arginase family protein [unclassified Actinopolyspora]NHD18166.1 arginase family protein [Actinopolyspora sp. BKK2]NHE77157.1 arginase family protein [Actinopolyspora sp. BKK1]
MTRGDVSALTVFRGRAGDHNERGMRGARLLGEELTRRTGSGSVSIGQSRPVLNSSWETELAAALPELRRLARRYEEILSAGSVPVTAMNRCAAGLATLPVVARHRPDACVVWLDAHPDLNTPLTSESGYLGGMVLAGATGMWDSGLGTDLSVDNVVLGGARDVDPAERRMLDEGLVRSVPPGADLPERLRSAVAGRPVYVHLDCDVLEPGILSTDYRIPGGMTLEQLRAVSEVLANHELVGIELGEFEGGGSAEDEAGQAGAAELVGTVEPLLRSLDDR